MGDVYRAMQRAGQWRSAAAPLQPGDEQTSTEGEVPAALPLREFEMAPHASVERPRLNVIPDDESLRQYRSIRYQILSRAHERRMQVHLVAGGAPREGRTTLAVHMGLCFSELRNGRSLVIEADLRRPTMSRLVSRPMNPGLVQLLRGEREELDQAIHATAHPGLHILPAGVTRGIGGEASSLLASPRMAMVIDRCRDLFDHLFLDSPALAEVTDACAAARWCDHALLAAKLDHSRLDQTQAARRRLDRCGCEIAGLVLTNVRAEAA